MRPRDVFVDALLPSEDVVFQRRAASRAFGSYDLTPLARTLHQPDLKTFLLSVDGDGEELQTHLHQFWYNTSPHPLTVHWPGGSRAIEPGDSVYAAPLVPYRFSSPRGQPAVLYVVRIPGRLTRATLDELATADPSGRDRIGRESIQWYS